MSGGVPTRGLTIGGIVFQGAYAVGRRAGSSTLEVCGKGGTWRIVLNGVPLPLHSAQQGGLVRASYPSLDAETRWQRLMSKRFGGICKPGQRSDNCLSLLDDVMGLSEWDKLGVGMALSIDPLKESISQAVEDTLAPQLFYTMIATGLVTWAVLAANPEPVFTKGAAVVSALLLIYLGVETFLEVVDACRELKWATDRATTWEELEQASQRFANRVGPAVARVFVLAVTVVVSHGMTGGAALLASRLSMLPRFSEAAAEGASRVGINLANVGQVSAVAVSAEGTITIVLAPGAVAAMALGPGGGNNTHGGGPGKSDHSRQRQAEGRPVGTAFKDASNARPADVFIQEVDGRVIVRAPRGREHIFERDGTLVTTVDGRSAAAHQRLVQNGARRPATEDEFNAFKALFGR